MPRAARSALAREIVSARYIVFDFDGPICDLFAAPAGRGERLAPLLAEQMKVRLHKAGALPEELAASDDPHRIYYEACGAAPCHAAVAVPSAALTAALRRLLDSFEMMAVGTARATPGAAELVSGLSRRNKRLAVASNNSRDAVIAYLERSGLLTYFDGPIVGRADDPRLMKPHPASLHTVMTRLGQGDIGSIDPGECLMIGDSPADAQAAIAAKFVFCGYARDARRRAILREADAPSDLLIEHLSELTAVLGEIPAGQGTALSRR